MARYAKFAYLTFAAPLALAAPAMAQQMPDAVVGAARAQALEGDRVILTGACRTVIEGRFLL